MAENPIHIEYNDQLQPLETLLRGVTRAGDFFATGTAEIPMPRLEVEGAGVLSFPVPASHVQELIRQATRAPYGRGEATILDESVRKVWQLPAERVHLGGRSWPTATPRRAAACSGPSSLSSPRPTAVANSSSATADARSPWT